MKENLFEAKDERGMSASAELKMVDIEILISNLNEDNLARLWHPRLRSH